MASLQYLPTELLLIVVRHLKSDGQSSIIDLCLVNRIFQPVCQSILYQDVKISTSDGFKRFATTVSRGSQVAEIVKSVYIESVFDFKYQDPQDQYPNQSHTDTISPLSLILEACKKLSCLVMDPFFDSFHSVNFSALQARLGSHKIPTLRRLSTTFDCERSTFAALASMFPDLEVLKLIRSSSTARNERLLILEDPPIKGGELAERVRELHLHEDFSVNEVLCITRMCPKIQYLDLSPLLQFTTLELYQHDSDTIEKTVEGIFDPIANTLQYLLLSGRAPGFRSCESPGHGGNSENWTEKASIIFPRFVAVVFETCPKLKVLFLDVEDVLWTTTLKLLKREDYCGEATELKWIRLWLRAEERRKILQHLRYLRNWMNRRLERRRHDSTKPTPTKLKQVLPSLERVELTLYANWDEEDRIYGMELVDQIEELGREIGIRFEYFEGSGCQPSSRFDDHGFLFSY